MKRRDFLLLKTEGDKQLAELSCEKLYMYFADSHSTDKLSRSEAGTANDAEWWSGEPPMVISKIDLPALFADVAEEISNIDLLIVKDREWIDDGEFGNYINSLLIKFEKQGGNISYAGQNRQASQE